MSLWPCLHKESVHNVSKVLSGKVTLGKYCDLSGNYTTASISSFLVLWMLATRDTTDNTQYTSHSKIANQQQCLQHQDTPISIELYLLLRSLK